MSELTMYQLGSNGREWYGSKSVTIAKLSKCDRRQ